MSPSRLSQRQIFSTWWPLAASWMLMGAELPAISAIIARLPKPEINLAAYGGIVYPLALIIEAPIIMLLGASTALSKDWVSYQKIRRFMMTAGAILTSLHLLVALTPLYDFIARRVIEAPAEIIAPGRIGLILMTPWTWAIAYRRFNQGVLIRYGYSQTVGIGTMIRLCADLLVLIGGYLLHDISGIVVATLAVSAGVLSEALYVGLVVRPVIREQVRFSPPAEPRLTRRAFFEFYIPLALTSLISLLAQPIGSAALSRMSAPLASLAAWPVVTGLVFMFRSPGVAFNEVVVALLDRPGSYSSLRKFTIYMASLTTLALILTAATPLSTWWFIRLSALSPDLSDLAQKGLWLALPLPFTAVLQSWFQGALLYGRRTRAVTEAVVVYLLTIGLLLLAGVLFARTVGLFIGLAAMGMSMLTQTLWLYLRSRLVLTSVRERDSLPAAAQALEALAE